MTEKTESTRTPMTRGLGTTGKLVLGGTVSTGLLLGGFAVGAMALAQRMNGGALLETSVGLFIVGAIGGMLISLAAGVVGRDDGMSWGDAGRDAAKGALYAVPACFVGVILAGWMGMAVIGLYLGSVLPIVGSVLAAVIGAGIMLATFRVTCASGMNVLRRVRQVI